MDVRAYLVDPETAQFARVWFGNGVALKFGSWSYPRAIAKHAWLVFNFVMIWYVRTGTYYMQMTTKYPSRATEVSWLNGQVEVITPTFFGILAQFPSD
jgi:hypothetical protein